MGLRPPRTRDLPDRILRPTATEEVGRALLPAVQDRFVPVVVVVTAHHEHVLDPEELLADRHPGGSQGGVEDGQDVTARGRGDVVSPAWLERSQTERCREERRDVLGLVVGDLEAICPPVASHRLLGRELRLIGDTVGKSASGRSDASEKSASRRSDGHSYSPTGVRRRVPIADGSSGSIPARPTSSPEARWRTRPRV